MRMKPTIILFLIVLSIVAGCGEGAYPVYGPVTEFIEFRYEPSDTVTVGVTLFIHCVIKDSLDTSMEYDWVFNGNLSRTSENKYVIRTEGFSSNQDYEGHVVIRSQEKPDHEYVLESFNFYLRENES